MITATNLVVLLMMVVGIIGIVVPVLPGLLLVWAGTLLWALESQSTTGWVVLGVSSGLYAAGLAAQYLLPGRRMRAAGVETLTIGLALAVAVVGFFVIPVIGAPIGFVTAIYVIERVKYRDHGRARTATVQALKAVALNMGIELTTALAILTTWAIGVWVSRP